MHSGYAIREGKGMTALADFKQVVAEVYRVALKHYHGDKARARACVEAYCWGLTQGAAIKGTE